MISRFTYFKPHNLNEAVQYLEKGEKSFVLAGGTDLMILLRRNIINAESIVDIKAIPETAAFEFVDGSGLTIGASVVVNRLVDSEVVKAKYPALNQAAASLASFQLRNRATLVGNICNASPGADLPPALLAYDAVVNIANSQGIRQVPLHQFFTGVKRTVLQRGELVVSVQLPEPGEGDKSIYLRQARLKGHDLATVGLACRIKPDSKVAIGICAVAPTPKRLFALEDMINERGLSLETVEWAAKEIVEHIHPITDVRSSASYRLQMASVLLKRGLLNLIVKED
ncbi:MAG TPA: xanthine dehydrogenase family protein subunit M [Anaerolineaceae bacterium]|nr:xanthine dehydrogenase family protein subunit M [Anaerolineaceae bacterium]